MAWSDFNWLTIGQTFNDRAPTTTVEFPVEGSELAGEPIDDAYLCISASGVSSNSHRIFINNKSLPGIDLPSHSGWQTWMDRIPSGFLERGNNTIRIDRIGNDRFHVHGVAVNWREPESLRANARSDFNWVTIDHVFNDTAPTSTVEFPIEGLQDHGGEPIDDAYLLIQALGVSSDSHRIFINNEPLPGIDLPSHSGWQTWMDRIPPGLLHKGTNTIRIDRIGNDQFRVYGVVVKWRETISELLVPRNVIFSDFNWVTIDQVFNDAAPTATVDFPIEGTEPAEDPIDDAYLLIQAQGVSRSSHRILINNNHLPSMDLPSHSGWQTWMDRIPAGLLKKGNNTIRIDRIGNDQFYVYGVVVNWRERAAAISP